MILIICLGAKMTEETFSLTNFRGDTLALDGTSGIYVLQHDGLAMPPVQRVIQEGPYQHGGTLLNSRLQPRVISLALANLAGQTATWTARDALFAMLNDIHDPLYLDCTRPDATTYRMDVTYLDSLTMPRAGQHDGFDRYVLQLIAYDPVWYNVSPQNVILDITAGGEGLEIDMQIPFGLGGTDIDESTWFVYAGTWISYPIVRITGPVDDAKLYTWTIGSSASGYVQLFFDGVTIAAGDYRQIDCRYGRKTVVDKNGANKIAELSADSDLASFGIYPYPYQDLAVFVFMGANGSGDTACSLTYYNRFIGI